MTKKLFIATSTFDAENQGLLKVLKINKVKFNLNPLKRKLNSKELIRYSENATHIIAGTELYNKEILSKLKNLKMIFRLGSGIDNIDLGIAGIKKIKVIKSEVTLEKAVGELTVGLIINLLRKISLHNQNLKKNIWKKQMGNLLFGKTVGIVGYGKIGKYVEKILKNFGVKILINDKKKVKNKTSLKNLIINSDIITLHTNYNNENLNLLNKNNLKFLKKNSIIVNTSRPEIIDYNYLYKILKLKRIKGAALDVFNKEPYSGKFRLLDNTILTPHIGSYAKEIRVAMEKEAVNSIIKN
tara:strand:- start:181 stop:1074 length:894 start_codon:yes stop_codon:yes gene_type:complete